MPKICVVAEGPARIATSFAAAEGVRAFNRRKEAAVSIVFEARTRRILYLLQVDKNRVSSDLLAIAVPNGVALEVLSDMDNTSSTDISPILEAASEGVGNWQKS